MLKHLGKCEEEAPFLCLLLGTHGEEKQSWSTVWEEIDCEGAICFPWFYLGPLLLQSYNSIYLASGCAVPKLLKGAGLACLGDLVRSKPRSFLEMGIFFLYKSHPLSTVMLTRLF